MTNILNQIISEEINNIIKENYPFEDIVFHGTDANFNKFDLAYASNEYQSQAHGYGIYLAKNEEDAKYYGKNKYKVEIPKVSKTNYLFQDIKPNQKIINKLCNKIFKLLIKTDYVGHDKELMRMMKPMYSTYDGETLYGDISYFLGGDEEASKFCREHGIYGIVFKLNNSLGYVIFDTNDIKIIDKIINKQ